MATYFAAGSPTTELSLADLRAGLVTALDQFSGLQRVLAIPPDFTRRHSFAGELTRMAHDYLGDRLVDVMPALGTHEPMRPEQLDAMFPSIPASLFRQHKWRTDVETVGEVPRDFVSQVTEGIYNKPWPAQMNRLAWRRQHDLIISLGQVVPHEVIGMANYNKNLFVGIGGEDGINQSHFIGASYGMERMMGRGDTPLRRILNYAQDTFCQHLPLLFVLTTVGTREDGQNVIRGLYIGDDVECFEQACQLSAQVNVTLLDEEPQRIVVYLDEDEFQSTWLGNKAVYRTRMAIADNGRLIVLAPGVRCFGEDPEIDRLIRAHGYRTTPEIMAAVDSHADLQANLSAAAHMIHGSAENRFRITYCPSGLSREEIESVGYEYAPLDQMLGRYDVAQLRPGWNTDADGQRFYLIRNPALGLWATRHRFGS